MVDCPECGNGMVLYEKKNGTLIWVCYACGRIGKAGEREKKEYWPDWTWWPWWPWVYPSKPSDTTSWTRKSEDGNTIVKFSWS